MNEDTDPPARPTPEEPRSTVTEFTFRMPNLPDVRDFAAACARRFGAGEAFVGDFLIAVNEVATNAVTHGADKARMRVWAHDGRLFVAVHDEGTWQGGSAPGHTPPPPHATHGMGLWVARRLSTDLSVTTDSAGTTVTMEFKV